MRIKIVKKINRRNTIIAFSISKKKTITREFSSKQHTKNMKLFVR